MKTEPMSLAQPNKELLETILKTICDLLAKKCFTNMGNGLVGREVKRERAMVKRENYKMKHTDTTTTLQHQP